MTNIFLTLNLRFPEDSAFGRVTLSNSRLLLAFLWAVIGSVLITEMGVMQKFFQTTSLTLDQWALCIVPGIILLIGGEILKIVLRAQHKPAAA